MSELQKKCDDFLKIIFVVTDLINVLNSSIFISLLQLRTTRDFVQSTWIQWTHTSVLCQNLVILRSLWSHRFNVIYTQKTIEGHLDSISSLTFNTIKTKLIIYWGTLKTHHFTFSVSSTWLIWWCFLYHFLSSCKIDHGLPLFRFAHAVHSDVIST